MAKKKKSSAFAVVQQIGKSFFLPVSVLPIAGILLGLGSSFTNADTIAAYHLQGIMGEGTILNALLTIMSQVGNTIFGNLPLIFALAVALGMAKNEKAVAVLSAGISFFVMNSTINAMLKLSGKILADGTYAKSVLNGQITSVCGIDSLQMGVFAGVIVGLVTAALHNRFYKQQLPAALAFFSGVRFVPIISVIAHIGVGIICFFVWPTIQSGIFALGNLVMHSGYFGTAIFGFLERALIPFGLHHVFYLPFWQTSLGGTMEVAGKMVEGAQNIFFAQLADPNTKHFAVEACRFMTGKYSFMMAGLPGAAYAMYRCAKPEKRKIVGGLLFSAALTSFLTGITEPIEFTFLFIAPGLFILHCGLAGLSFALMHILKICIGTTFSCGLIDFMLYGVLQGQTKSNWMMILPVFAVYAVLYYFVFKFVIEKFDLPTPGRDDDEEEVKLYTKADYQAKKGAANEDTGAPEDPISFMILKGLGGIKNIEDIDCCATRLAMRLREEHMYVIGMGESKTPVALTRACNKFIHLNLIYEADRGKEEDMESDEIENVTSLDEISYTIADIISENGNAPVDLGKIGNRLNAKYSDFDVRNYGYTKLSVLIDEEMDNFMLVQEDTNCYVEFKELTSRETIEEEVIHFVKKNGGSLDNLSAVTLELKDKHSGFNIKDYGYSRMSSFLRSIRCLTVNGNTVRLKKRREKGERR